MQQQDSEDDSDDDSEEMQDQMPPVESEADKQSGSEK